MSDKQSALMNIPEPVEVTRSANIKSASPDIVQYDKSIVPVEFMTDLLFESIGGQEILSVSRNDLVNGQNVIYSPIKNLSKINQGYNSHNLIPLPPTSESYFSNFPIKLEAKTTEFGSGPNSETVYIDLDTGDLIINVSNLLTNEQVEVDVLNAIDHIDDILYGVQEES